jgi:hypothetical protein
MPVPESNTLPSGAYVLPADRIRQTDALTDVLGARVGHLALRRLRVAGQIDKHVWCRRVRIACRQADVLRQTRSAYVLPAGGTAFTAWHQGAGKRAAAGALLDRCMCRCALLDRCTVHCQKGGAECQRDRAASDCERNRCSSGASLCAGVQVRLARQIQVHPTRQTHGLSNGAAAPLCAGVCPRNTLRACNPR